MKVGGKEIGFLFTVGVHCDYLDWCCVNETRSKDTGSLVKIEYATRAYAKKNGTNDFLTVAEMRDMPTWEFRPILEAALKAEAEQSKPQVETVEAPKKKEAGK